MVISALIFFYNDVVDVKKEEANSQDVERIIEFNKSFESYNKVLYGSELLSLANKIDDYNEQYVNGKNDGYDEIKLSVQIGSETKDAQYFIDLIDDIDEIMETYKYSNYLEALYNANEQAKSTIKKEQESAEMQKSDILAKIGLKKVPNKISDHYNLYIKYKELKNKKFKVVKIEYSKDNGRVNLMSYKEK